MLIIINGNIASGKSAVCQHLHTLLGWPVLALDELRRLHNPDVNYIGERLALNALIDAVTTTPDAIVEITSANSQIDLVMLSHPGITKMVYIQCPADVCLRRHEARMAAGYEMPPFPYNTRSVAESIRYLGLTVSLFEHDMVYDSVQLTPDEIAADITKHIHGH